jgi:hypothetical protein
MFFDGRVRRPIIRLSIAFSVACGAYAQTTPPPLYFIARNGVGGKCRIARCTKDRL